MPVYLFLLRLAKFENYMMEMEELTRKLNDENLSPEEYQKVLERFKVCFKTLSTFV